jgi:hypothetical protein
MPRTRSTRSKPAPKEITPEPAPSTVTTLAPSVENPPKLFVLPKDTSKDTRIVTLDDPANGVPSRYLFCPEKGFYEFTRIAAPKRTPRSWLITSEKSLDDEEGAVGSTSTSEDTQIGAGYITKTADLFIATPIDLLFLILPVLAPKSAKETKQLFLSLDDHLDNLSFSSRHFKALLAQHASLKAMIERRMATICDTVDAGDEIMYRISTEKLYNLMVKKAQRMSKNGLPASMEARFIKPVLDIPVLSIKREESSTSIVSESTPTTGEESQDSAMLVDSQTTSTAPTPDSQTTSDTQTTTATSVAMSVTEEVSTPALQTPPEIPHLLRLRTSLTYLLSSYIPATLQSPLKALILTSTFPIDFMPLSTHLAALAKLKAEATALRSISDNISRKRGYEDDEEKMAEREEKKRKKEEEEKKKKTESRGVKALKKVDTSGMMKLSSFFTKAPAKKA